MSDWKKIVALEEIPTLGSRVVKRHDGGDIAIFRTSDDRVFALHDHCPHKGGPLSQGIVHGDKVTCPLHSWNIGLGDGCAVAPDEGRTACFEVKLEAGFVYLNI
jgi:nitrite reductase (NADH) small subunit